jgi:cytochrome c553
MPSQTFARLSAPDMAALIAYLRTVKPDGEAHPPRHWGPDFAAKTSADDRKLAPELVEEFRRDTPMDLGKRHAWGRYLVSTTCSECHGPALKGYVEPYTPNLNAVATYDLAQFRRLMREGVSVDGERDLGLMARVAKSHFSKLTDDEVKAIYDYLAVRAAKG